MSSRERSTRIPLADSVYTTLFEQLMGGTRLPGQSLNISVLSSELNVSQTPIREALARLENTGLVHRYALRGYEVTALLTEEEIVELTDARLLLEPAFAATAATNATPEFLDKLARTINAMANPAQSSDQPRLSGDLSADESFHLLISAQTGNVFLDRAYRSLRSHVQRFRLLSGTATSHAMTAAPEHQAIYDALKAGDPDTAAEMMRIHLVSANSRMLADYSSRDSPSE